MHKEGHIEDWLKNAHCLVTYGSCTSVNALLAGVPAICLGPNPARPVCSRSLDDIENPPFPRERKLRIWLNNLAWCQWSAKEFRSGEAWDFLERELAATA